MAKITVTITDPVGLHARPASVVVQEANKFGAEFEISTPEGKTANLKSIMSVMAMGVKSGESVTIEGTGSDAEAGIAAIEAAMKENGLV